MGATIEQAARKLSAGLLIMIRNQTRFFNFETCLSQRKRNLELPKAAIGYAAKNASQPSAVPTEKCIFNSEVCIFLTETRAV
jgi:hypothetical protein